MLVYTLRRLLTLVPVLWAAATLTFLSVHLAPGDPATTQLAQSGASAAAIAQRRAAHGLDDPLELHILTKLAENTARIESLRRSVEKAPFEADCSDIMNELEYLKSDIELGLIEIEAEIEEAPSSEEILAQEAEAILA